jgi:hypothetical protein
VLLYDLVTTGHLSTTAKRKLLSAVDLAFAAGQAAPAQRQRVPETWSQVDRAVQLLVSRIGNEPAIEPFFKSVTLPLPVGIEGAAHLLAPEASRTATRRSHSPEPSSRTMWASRSFSACSHWRPRAAPTTL